MFLDKALDEIGRKNKIVIGLDLTNDYVQGLQNFIDKLYQIL